jgi:hypothetical protein
MWKKVILLGLMCLVCNDFILAQEPKSGKVNKKTSNDASTKDNKITPELKNRINELINQLGDKEFQVREKAQTELIETGEIILDELIKARKNNNNPEIIIRMNLIEDEIKKRLRASYNAFLIKTACYFHAKVLPKQTRFPALDNAKQKSDTIENHFKSFLDDKKLSRWHSEITNDFNDIKAFYAMLKNVLDSLMENKGKWLDCGICLSGKKNELHKPIKIRIESIEYQASTWSVDYRHKNGSSGTCDIVSATIWHMNLTEFLKVNTEKAVVTELIGLFAYYRYFEGIHSGNMRTPFLLIDIKDKGINIERYQLGKCASLIDLLSMPNDSNPALPDDFARPIIEMLQNEPDLQVRRWAAVYSEFLKVENENFIENIRKIAENEKDDIIKTQLNQVIERGK